MLADYIDLVAGCVANGTRRYRAAAEEMTRTLSPQIASCVSQAAYSEPLLFAALSSEWPDHWIEQVTLGYLPSAARPARLTMTTDDTGVVYIPGLGSIAMKRPDPRMSVSFDPKQDVDCLSPRHMVGRSEVELLPGGHPLLDRFYVDDRGGKARVRFAGLPEAHSEHLNRALEVVASVHPRYAALLETTLRTVVLHHGDQPNSFATPAAHGAVFINMALGADEIFLLEDLVHQGGHVLFSAASFERQQWFSASPETRLRDGDARSVYIALHGVFTEAAMVDVLDAWLAVSELPERQEHELAGRLAFNLRRLISDVETLADAGCLSTEGVTLLRALARIAHDVASRRPGLARARFDNQSYNFSYELFAARNPLPAATRG